MMSRPDNQTTEEPPNKNRYKEPWKVGGRNLFGYWLPFFGFRDEIPPAEFTIHLGLRGRIPALVFQWLGLNFQMFFKNSWKKKNGGTGDA